jgi:hypothetical protein
MSGNIHDTNTDRIREDVYGMITDVTQYCMTEYALKQKYKCLVETSSTLFNMVLKEASKPGFNQESFKSIVEMMLGSIVSIQDSKTSQYDASAKVGTHLAEMYIPQLKKQKKNLD